jgi:hypothetical protein
MDLCLDDGGFGQIPARKERDSDLHGYVVKDFRFRVLNDSLETYKRVDGYGSFAD